MATEMRACDVHVLIDKDSTPRECAYCGRCKKWMCKECRTNWPKRAHAMMLAKMKPQVDTNA